MLGRQYDPFFTACKPYSEKKCKYAYPERVLGDVVLPEMKLADEISLDRLDSRRTLVEQFNAELRRIEHLGVTDRLDLSRRQAFDLLTSANRSNSPWRAFSVDDEADTLKDRYGRNLYGQSMMIARRLVESDVRFVTVTWEVFEKAGVDEDGWDTHRRNFDILRDHRLPVLDRAYSALCEDLDERGLLVRGTYTAHQTGSAPILQPILLAPKTLSQRFTRPWALMRMRPSPTNPADRTRSLNTVQSFTTSWVS